MLPQVKLSQARLVQLVQEKPSQVQVKFKQLQYEQPLFSFFLKQMPLRHYLPNKYFANLLILHVILNNFATLQLLSIIKQLQMIQSNSYNDVKQQITTRSNVESNNKHAINISPEGNYKKQIIQEDKRFIRQDKKNENYINSDSQQEKQQKMFNNNQKNINLSQRDINLSKGDIVNPLESLNTNRQNTHKMIGHQKHSIQSYEQLLNQKHINQLNISSMHNKTYEQCKRENLQLKNKNQMLKKQLQIFSQKLDQQIRKRITTTKQKKKNYKPQLVESMELQNAYKKIQIYKKQISTLKAKRGDFDDDKQNQYQNKIKCMLQEIVSLKEEIKTINKILKTQEKGLVQVGAAGYFKVSEQNQKHKEEIRKLQTQIDQIQRKYRANNNNISSSAKHNTEAQSEYRSAKGKTTQNNNNNFFDKRSETTQKMSDRNRRQKNVSLRIKTQSNIVSEQNSEQDSKMQKYDQKIRILTAQKSRQRQIIQNLKIQIIQKDKEIICQKDKIQSLRKIVKQKQKFQKYAHSQNKQKDKQQKSPHKQNIKEQINLENQRQNIPKGIQKIEERQQAVHKLINSKKYPRLDEKGLKSWATYKWNHHQFSSKMKQIRILPNKLGFIKDINVRYQKGEPKHQTQNLLSGQKYSSFVCEEGQQYIKQIKGGFKNGYLQYLMIKTNYNRKAKFCKYDSQGECDNFDFNIEQQEFPCALYGQNDNQGVKRIGCFIQTLKNTINNSVTIDESLS